MAKKVLLLIFGAFILTNPVIAFGSYPSFHYPDVPGFDNKNTNGVFNVYVESEGVWQNAGVLSFDRYFRQRTLDITNQVVGRNSVRIKLTKEGGGSAHIDSVLVNNRPPLSAAGREADLKKLMQDDFDVVDASGKGIELEFTGTEGSAILSLSARIEGLLIAKTPFQYPVENLYKEIGLHSKFYHYNIEKGNKRIEKEIFHQYSLTGSGHPSGYTYGWASNDERNLYVRIDFTPDNTMDGDKDYAKVYVKTEEGIREFKVSVPETQWGNATFTYTDKVSYQHKVYDLVIPLKEIGITDASKADEITLAFAAYGTAAPRPDCYCYEITCTNLDHDMVVADHPVVLCFNTYEDRGLFSGLCNARGEMSLFFDAMNTQALAYSENNPYGYLKFHGDRLHVVTGIGYCLEDRWTLRGHKVDDENCPEHLWPLY